jgi:hypothetical protein
MFKTSLLSIASLISFSVIAMDFQIDKVRAPKHLGNLEVCYKGNEFVVQEEGKEPVAVNKAHLDKNLQLMSAIQVKALSKKGAIMGLEKLPSGQYMLKMSTPVKGGALGGATFGVVLGQVLVHGTAQTIIWGTSLLAGPAAPIVGSTAAVVSLPYVVPIATYVSLCLGPFFGIITGPI